MADRKYYVFTGHFLGMEVEVKEKKQVTEERWTFFGTRKETVEKEVPVKKRVPLLFYLEDGAYREFFTGDRLKGSPGLMWFENAGVPESSARQFGGIHMNTYGSMLNVREVNPTVFADRVKELMPCRDRIVKAIRDYEENAAAKYAADRARKDAEARKALSDNQRNEAWLDSIIGGRK